MKVEKGKTYFYAKDEEPLICIKAVEGENNQSTFLSKSGVESKMYNCDMYRNRHMRVNKTIQCLLPKGSFNIGISLESTIYADSNDSNDWWRLAIPLGKPRGKWVIVHEIKTEDGVSLTLADKY